MEENSKRKNNAHASVTKASNTPKITLRFEATIKFEVFFSPLRGLLIPYMASVSGKPVVMGWELVPEQNKVDQNEKTNGYGEQLAPVRALFLESI